MRRKNYKENLIKNKMKKVGQVTIFIIVAIVIVVAGVLVYFLFPGVTDIFRGDTSPAGFMKSCMGDEIENGIELLSRQGGYENPEGSVMYRGENIKYLCYTAKYYEPCLVQQPMIRAKFEEELGRMVKAKAESCVNDFQSFYERRGYAVEIGTVEPRVEISPGKIDVVIETPMTITKETSESFDEIRVSAASELYDLLMISTSIIDYESTYGDSETTLYTTYYPNLNIVFDRLQDGTKIYTLSDVTSGDSFTFAVRSLAWPPGYG